MGRLRRTLRRTCITLLLLEGVLQAAAVVFHVTLRSRVGVTAAVDGTTILCIGDSYTYGLGASAEDKSYPGVMQATLAQTTRSGPAVHVVNAGWPGRNSRDALLHLEQQLRTHRPELVFVLVGLNDTWSRPEQLDLEAVASASPDDGPRWQWRWRTGRLLQIAFGGGEVPFLTQGANPTAAAPPRTTPPATTPTTDAPRKPSTPLFDRAVRLLQQGDATAAIAQLEQAAIAEPDKAPECYQGLVQAHTQLGQRDRARTALAWLEQQWQQRETRGVAESLAVALSAIGDRQRAAQFAQLAAQKLQDSSTLWWIAGQGQYDAGNLDAAEQALDRAVAAAAGGDAGWRATLMRDCARASCARDTCKAVGLLVAALALDRDVERCRLIVEGAAARFAVAPVRACLARLALTGEQAELAQRLFATSWPERSAQCAVLEHHLRGIVARCRAHGAQPVLLTYPMPVPDLEAVQGEVARALSLELVPVRAAFDTELGRRSRQDLFIYDGHCSDAGYALMGQVAASAASRLLGR